MHVPRVRMGGAAVAMVGALTLATGCAVSAAPAASTADATGSGTGRLAAGVRGLDWSTCGGAQCATLTVPADWHHPHATTTKINLARLPARDPAHRRGALVVNLGSGNTTSALTGGHPPTPLAGLTKWFDVVAFDPPGLGSARTGTLIRCARPPAPVDGLVLARTAEQWRAHERANAAYDASCRKAAGSAYRSLNSWQVAHDMDALRAALGERRLRYFGNSYGTSYGQAYAELFGPRVVRMYLDGVPDHTRTRLTAWLRTYAVTQEHQLGHFRDWCAKTASCALHGTDAAKVWAALVRAARRAPLPAPGAGKGVTVNLDRLYAGALVGMNPPSWPKLAYAMDAARKGDAAEFRTVLRWPAGEGFGSVQSALLCHDYLPDPPGRAAFARIERGLRRVAPRFGWIEGRFELGRCAGMRTGRQGAPVYRPHPLHARTRVPVLVAIGDLDATTPNRGAAHVVRQWPGARALRHGDGHAAFVLGNTCLAGHVDRYLTTGALPPRGTRCPGELASKIG